jgi:hypothetical protein
MHSFLISNDLIVLYDVDDGGSFGHGFVSPASRRPLEWIDTYLPNQQTESGDPDNLTPYLLNVGELPVLSTEGLN